MTINKQRVRLYLWIGVAYLALWLFSDLISRSDHFYPERVLNNIWRIAYIAVVNFCFFEYSFPYVMKRRKYIISNIVLGILVFWIYLMAWSFGLWAWRTIGIGMGVYTPLTSFDSVQDGVETQMGFSVASILFFAIIKYNYDFRKLKATAQQLKIEKQQAELNYLKSQTNPHFLFNTLNNIYSLARDKSDLAPQAVLKLSGILRYMLYETGGTYIAVERELNIIHDYLSLERLRYDETLQVNFHYHVDDMKQSLPPLLLMPLVENAFKHGVSETRGRPFVDIHLSVKNRQLLFVVKNSTGSQASEMSVKKNIGLSNLERQLELLYTDYTLSAGPSGEAFVATLKINLFSDVQAKMHYSRR